MAPGIKDAPTVEPLPSLTEQRDYWDARWDRQRQPNYFQTRRGETVLAILQTLRLDNPTILDFGCGTGWFTERLCHVGRATGELENAREFFRTETQTAEDRLFFLQLRDVVQGTASIDYFQTQVEKLRAAAADGIVGDPIGVVELAAKRYRLTEPESADQGRLWSMLRSMAGLDGGARDALTRYTRALTGAYYFVPSTESIVRLESVDRAP